MLGARARRPSQARSRLLPRDPRGAAGEAFEVLLEALKLEGGAAFSVDGTFVELVSERGLSGKLSERPLAGRSFLPLLLELTGRTAARRKSFTSPISAGRATGAPA